MRVYLPRGKHCMFFRRISPSVGLVCRHTIMSVCILLWEERWGEMWNALHGVPNSSYFS